jgi:hypothetical protein
MNLTFDTKGNEKQKDCVRAWIDPAVSDIVYGGAKGGAKSFTGCKLIFGDALMYSETHYFIARKELSALRKFTIPSIHECFQDWGIDINKYAKFNGQDNFFQLYNASRVYLLDVAYMPSDPLYMRFGSMQFTRGWGEEVGEWEEAAKNNLMAAVGRWKNKEHNLSPKLLQTCNPSKNYLYRNYYKPWKNGTLNPWERFIQALPTDNKMLSSEYIQNLERTLNKNEKQRLLYGNWEYDSNPAALMDYEKITDIFTNTHVPEGTKYISADIARLGGDRIVIITWSGLRGKVIAFDKVVLPETLKRIEAARIRESIGKSAVLVDSDGMGSSIEDFGGFKGFTNNARAMPDPKKPTDANGKPVTENFDNLKSQCGFRMAEIINANGLFLECEDWMRPLIVEELEQVQQKALDSDMKKGLLPKDKVKELIGRSPDFWDAILMRIYFELKPRFVSAAQSV